MLSTLVNAWKLPELRKKIIFTLLMFLVFRIAAHIPVPGVDSAALSKMLGADIWGLIDTFSGGAFKNFTVVAMGIMPYINASIIMNLLTIMVPYFERLAKEGPEGRKKMAQYTRYGAVGLAFLQAIGMCVYLKGAFVNTNLFHMTVVVVTLTAGTAFLMWLGELITEKGIGNGISLIIFAGIVTRFPSDIKNIYQYLVGGQTNIFVVLIFLLIAVIIVAGVVIIQEGQRRIPVQYAKRVVGRKMYGGQSTHIPIKVNQTGVIPIIFAMSILMFPTTIASFFPNSGFATAILNIFNQGHPVYMIVYALLIIFFTYFYTAVTFNPVEVAENLKKYGGFIPGLRPGRPTVEYLDKILSRITLAGAIFLAIIALMPQAAMAISGLPIYFGGTSLLIVVGVALDTMKQLESQMLQRHYQGFMK
ncbi:MAG: preprotein translocase subunit SecY [Clostridia bacterium]|nr:preprotein translocase subunit SecY [Clostridia bacterium]